MTREQIIALAKQCGGDICEFGMNAIEGLQFYNMEQLEAFFHAAQAIEREACAKVCDELFNKPFHAAPDCAAAIRNRGTT